MWDVGDRKFWGQKEGRSRFGGRLDPRTSVEVDPDCLGSDGRH